MDTMRRIAATIVPALCVVCRGPCASEEVVCSRCGASLERMAPVDGDPPPGIEACWSRAAHAGIARELVFALKFRRLRPAAELMAGRIAAAAPDEILDGVIVPVPPAPRRARARGFDPANDLAAHLHLRLDLMLFLCLERRGEGRQVGRKRSERIAVPPRIAASGPAPERVLLVDDVMTTGATLSSCAAALRAAGARRVAAVTFARKL
jgi:predicted amidophosphoribosyltransferase